MVQEFYTATLLVSNISDVAWEVTIRNTHIMFSSDELVRFIGYERPLDTFLTIWLPVEDQPSTSEVFRTMLGPNIVVLKGSNMNH